MSLWFNQAVYIMEKKRRRRSPKKSPFNIKRLPFLLLLPILALLITTSFQKMKASIINSQTQQYLAFWRKELKHKKQGFILPEKAVQTAREGAERAVALDPDSPVYLTALGNVEDWVVNEAQRQGKPVDKVAQQEGLEAYRKAIALRPAWPYAWAEFAMAKARASEIDQEFYNALERATTLGPWEQTVMDTVAQLGLWYGDFLPGEVRVAVDGNLARYAEQYPWQALALGRRLGRVEVVCALVLEPEKFRRDCR